MAKHILLGLLVTLVACASREPSKKAKMAELHYAYGTQALVAQDYTEAISHLLKAATFAPKDPNIQNNLGMAYYFKGDREKAKEHVGLALELNPANTDARSNLASFMFEDGDLAGAQRLYRECLKDLTYEKQARVYYNLALIDLRHSQPNAAMANLRRALKEDEGYCPAWFQVGMLDFKARRWKDAQKAFREAGLGQCGNDPAPLYWQAMALTEMGDYLAARVKLDDVETRFHRSPYAAMAKDQLSRITLLERGSQNETVVAPQREASSPAF